MDVSLTHPKVVPSLEGFKLTATAVSRTQIDLSWTMPADNGGAKISGYQLDWIADNTLPATITVGTDVCGEAHGETDGTTNPPPPCPLVLSTTDQTFEHMKLRPNTTYYYQVTAINSEGRTVSDTVSATTPVAARPGMPTDLVAVPFDTDTIQLYWNEPADNGGFALAAPADDNGTVEFQYKATAGASWPATWTATDDTTNASILTAGAAAEAFNATFDSSLATVPGFYRFRVRSLQSGDGTVTPNMMSSWAYLSRQAMVELPVELDTDTNRKQPGQPVLNVASIDDADTAARQGNRLTWTDHDTSDITDPTLRPPAASDYRIDVSDDDGLKWERLQTQTARLAQYEHRGLKAGDQYYYRLLPITGNYYGEGHAVLSAAVVAAADTPEARAGRWVKAEGTSTTRIEVTWSAEKDTSTYYIQSALVDGDTGLPTDGTTVGNWGAAEMVTGTSYTDDGTLYLSTGDKLGPGDKRWYRVFADVEGGGNTAGTRDATDKLWPRAQANPRRPAVRPRPWAWLRKKRPTPASP